MLHFIKPTIDCVFKAILGSEKHINLLRNFLNSILLLVSPIMTLKISNPYNERTYLDEKLSIVDIKAVDNEGRVYQIEIQLSVPKHLRDRILYTWGSVQQGQIIKGDNYDQLQSTISIWMLTKNMFKGPSFHHRFKMYDNENDEILSDKCDIHVLELMKWHKPERLQQRDNWLYFFKHGGTFKSLPAELITQPEMRQAMGILTDFSDRAHAYHIYQSRQDAMRDYQTRLDAQAEAQKLQIQAEARAAKAEAERANEKARAESEAARAESEAARAESEAARAAKAETERENEKARAENEAARAENEAARAEKAETERENEKVRAENEAARAESATTKMNEMRQLLLQQGIDPDAS